MSRFVRLSEGHYINLDLVTDIFITGDPRILTFRYVSTDNEGCRLTHEEGYDTEADARAELGRLIDTQNGYFAPEQLTP